METTDTSDRSTRATGPDQAPTPDQVAERPSTGTVTPPRPEPSDATSLAYCVTDTGIEYYRDRGEAGSIRLTNWTATIIADVTHDDGTATSRVFTIEARQGGRRVQIDVAPDRLRRVGEWALHALGATAQIAVHPRIDDHLLLAIQQASPDPTRRTVYTATGWRDIDNETVFLHAAGAIGANGPRTDIEVALPGPLAAYALPTPAPGPGAQEALRAALSLLDLAPDAVTIALFGAVWRAPLGDSQISVWITGRTGTGKTELTTLAQQHFGADFAPHRLPAAWSGTANSITELAHLAKDVVLTIDDFVPKGDAASVGRAHATAETVFRAQGNGAGRSRMAADGTLRGSRPPRGTIVGTGEDIPNGESLRSRLYVAELGPADLDFTALTTAQDLARRGTYATAMAGYIQWLAAHPDRLRNTRQSMEEIRTGLPTGNDHHRTPTLLAEILLGWHTVLDYAVACGAIDTSTAQVLRDRALTALLSARDLQRQHQADDDPTTRFVDLLSAALSAGHAHLASRDGQQPARAQAWGWRQDRPDGPCRPHGERIGYIDDDAVYLLPAAVMKVLTTMTTGGQPLAQNPTTLAKRLEEKGLLLASEKEARGTLTVRKVIAGRRETVWHLRATTFGDTAT